MDVMADHMGGTVLGWGIAIGVSLVVLALIVIKLVRKSTGMEKRRGR